MNRVHAVVVAALVSAAPVVAHADAPPPENEVLADLGLHVIGAGYQRTVAPHIALQVDADFYGPWTQSLANDHGAQATTGWVGRARVFYFVKRGLWLSPFVQAGAAKGDVDKTWGLAAAAGAAVGYAWLFSDSIALAIGVGAQYHYADTNPGFSSVWPHADLNVGYAF